MKSIGEIEEDLADKTEPILGFRPSSKIKRGPIGIVISIICVVIVLLESVSYTHLTLPTTPYV